MISKIIQPAFKENNVPICLFSDDYYVPYLATAVCSAISNTSDATNLDILIFENGYTEENKQFLMSMGKDKKNISIRFIDMRPFVSMLTVNPSKKVSVNCFAKIFCTDEIFKEYEKIIVLDSDLLILQDLMELYKTDLKGKMVGAVKDIYFDVMLESGYHTDDRLGFISFKQYAEAMGLDSKNYFNSGVLLYDIKKCQEADVQTKIVDINNNYPTMMYAAQDDLNILFKDNWTQIDDKWNVQNPYSICSHIDKFPEGYVSLMDTAGILHFLGKSKPWNDKKMWKGELFTKYAMQTPWKELYLARARKNERKNRVRLFLLPKGSKRREVFYKVYYFIKQKKVYIFRVGKI